MWSTHIKHNQAGADDSECLIWIFWVCRLSPTWYTVDCSQVLTQLYCYHVQQVYPTMEHHPTKNHSQETSQNALDMFNQSQHLFYTLQKSLCFAYIFTFLEIIKHTMTKCCFFSSIFNIKMAIQKSTNFVNIFERMLTW